MRLACAASQELRRFDSCPFHQYLHNNLPICTVPSEKIARLYTSPKLPRKRRSAELAAAHGCRVTERRNIVSTSQSYYHTVRRFRNLGTVAGSNRTGTLRSIALPRSEAAPRAGILKGGNKSTQPDMRTPRCIKKESCPVAHLNTVTEKAMLLTTSKGRAHRPCCASSRESRK